MVLTLQTRRCSHHWLHFVSAVISLTSFLASAHAQEIFTASSETASANYLPDAPSVVFQALAQEKSSAPALPPPCPLQVNRLAPAAHDSTAQTPAPSVRCIHDNPLRIVVNSYVRQPLSVEEKGRLAIRDVIHPYNLAFTAAEAGVGIAANSHSAYGPGFKGWGKLTGYQLVQGAQGEFFGTFLIPSLAREDPRYRRMQNATVKRRILHALERTIVAEHDDGRRMPNYATLLTYPISAELSNLYVPGIKGNGPDTMRRIAIGYATDPISNIISEFLPDFARRIHVRTVFIQQIVNSIALRQDVGMTP